MNKYVYQVVSAKGVDCGFSKSRKEARGLKRICERCPLEDVPPFKIVRYELTNPEVVR